MVEKLMLATDRMELVAVGERAEAVRPVAVALRPGETVGGPRYWDGAGWWAGVGPVHKTCVRIPPSCVVMVKRGRDTRLRGSLCLVRWSGRCMWGR